LKHVKLSLDIRGHEIILPAKLSTTPEKLPVSKAFTDIYSQALEALIARVSEAKDNQLALSGEDCQLLLDALVTLASMQDRLASHDVTVHK
jgi:hypothetical protein